MRESSDAEEQIVLQDVAHPVFLLYIYTDQALLVGEISSELAVHLLIAAERFLLDRLKASQPLCRLSKFNEISTYLQCQYHVELVGSVCPPGP
ncbi:treZ [Symbiodinium sp. CCMP2592]|nr:treZ [Symbiodinium sp. CCMP2592]